MQLPVLSAIMQRIRLRLYPELEHFPASIQGRVLRRVWDEYTAPSVPMALVGVGSGGGYLLVRATVQPWMHLPKCAESITFLLMAAIGLQILRWYYLRPMRRRLRERLVRSGVPICLSCGYVLKGLGEPRCPECGCEFDPKLLQVRGPC